MKGLLIKDILNFRSQGRFYIIALLLLGFYSVIQNVPFILPFAGIIIIWISLINSFNLDETCKWPSFILTTSMSRKALALSKYTLTAFLLACSFVLSLPLFIGWALIIKSFSLQTLLFFSFIAAIGGWVLCNFLIPIFIKFGAEKGRLCSTIATFALYIIFFFVGNNKQAISTFFAPVIPYWKPLALVLLILLSAGSILLSLHIIEKKEY